MERPEITPFRMQILMDIAAKVVKTMVTGAWHLTFEEMDTVLALIKSDMDEIRKRNESNGNSEESGGQTGCGAGPDEDRCAQI